jgi:type I restriction enzyme M protein
VRVPHAEVITQTWATTERQCTQSLIHEPIPLSRSDNRRLQGVCLGPARRFPFGLPPTDNANYLWIQLFYSVLKNGEARTSGGRAGFLIANSVSDAPCLRQELREKLIEELRPTLSHT